MDDTLPGLDMDAFWACLGLRETLLTLLVTAFLPTFCGDCLVIFFFAAGFTRPNKK